MLLCEFLSIKYSSSGNTLTATHSLPLITLHRRMYYDTVKIITEYFPCRLASKLKLVPVNKTFGSDIIDSVYHASYTWQLSASFLTLHQSNQPTSYLFEWIVTKEKSHSQDTRKRNQNNFKVRDSILEFLSQQQQSLRQWITSNSFAMLSLFPYI